MTNTAGMPLIVPASTVGAGAVPVLATGGPVTLHTWQEFVTAVPKVPKMMPVAEYSAGTARQRQMFDAARQQYHRSLSDIETSQMLEAHKEIQSRVDGSDGAAPTARVGLIVNGMPNLGKSTIVLRWGKNFEVNLRKKFRAPIGERTSNGGLFIPVVHVILGRDDGPKGLCTKLLDFYQAGPAGRSTTTQLTSQLRYLAETCGTRVIIIDQMQNLVMRNKSAQQTAAHIKELMDVLPVTFIGAGVAMESTGFLSEGLSTGNADLSQVGERFGLFDIQPFSRQNKSSRLAWNSFLATVESKLLLFGAKQRDVLNLTDYVYERTDGVTGTVMDLLRRGANEAVGNEERITESVLNRVTLSTVAENRSRRDPVDADLADHANYAAHKAAAGAKRAVLDSSRSTKKTTRPAKKVAPKRAVK